MFPEAGLEPTPLPYEGKILPIKLFHLRKILSSNPQLLS